MPGMLIAPARGTPVITMNEKTIGLNQKIKPANSLKIRRTLIEKMLSLSPGKVIYSFSEAVWLKAEHFLSKCWPHIMLFTFVYFLGHIIMMILGEGSP